MTSPTPSADRAALRGFLPEKYLANGWRDAQGRLFPDISRLWATAAAEQLLAGQVAVQELETTLQAFLQTLPYYQDKEPLDFVAVGFESLHLVAGLLGQPNNPTLVAWIEPCVLAVRDMQDAKAFLTHLRAVALQYPVLARGNTSPIP